MTYTGSIRCEGDTWDLASSVGATATMVAAARAMATRAANPLINDQFAEPLVRAVGVDVLTRLASGELTASDIDDPERPNASMVRMAEHHAVRTKFFDEFFMDATRAGIRQVVILASGLDSRAYRLAWPAQTVVYEIDQPQVMEFKTRTLAELGATPTADRRVGSPPICVRIGPPRWARRDSTRPSPPRGALKGCSATSRRKRRTACWTMSPRSVCRTAGLQPRAYATSSRIMRNG